MNTAHTIVSDELCPHCGQPLLMGVISLCGKTHHILLGDSCGCEQARRDMEVSKPSAPQKQPTPVELYDRAGIPREYQGIRLACDEYTQAIKSGRNVFICGDNGTSKSTLAASVGMELIDEGARVVFVNAAIEAQSIKNEFGIQGTEYDRMATAPVLIVDDMGKGVSTDWETSLWYAVAEARNAAQLPTLTTTNYDGGELIRRLTVNGDDSTAKAIVSRLRRDALTLKTKGQDRRLQPKR